MLDAAIFSIPRPQLGDCMERLSLDGLIEEAMVVSIKYHKENPDHWNAVMVTRNGFEFVACQREFRGEHDWRPKGWEYRPQLNAFLPAGAKWDAENRILTWPETAKKGLPKSGDLPVPVFGEKYMSWRARVYRTFPVLKESSV